MAIAIDTVCTEAQLDDFLGGQVSATTNLVPSAWASAEKARQYALDRIVEVLARRTPPIREADISDVTQLRTAVLLGASERLYTLAMTGGGDAELFGYQAREYGKRFEAELRGLQVTTSDGSRVTTFSIGISRR